MQSSVKMSNYLTQTYFSPRKTHYETTQNGASETPLVEGQGRQKLGFIGSQSFCIGFYLVEMVWAKGSHARKTGSPERNNRENNTPHSGCLECSFFEIILCIVVAFIGCSLGVFWGLGSLLGNRVAFRCDWRNWENDTKRDRLDVTRREDRNKPLTISDVAGVIPSVYRSEARNKPLTIGDVAGVIPSVYRNYQNDYITIRYYIEIKIRCKVLSQRIMGLNIPALHLAPLNVKIQLKSDIGDRIKRLNTSELLANTLRKLQLEILGLRKKTPKKKKKKPLLVPIRPTGDFYIEKNPKIQKNSTCIYYYKRQEKESRNTQKQTQRPKQNKNIFTKSQILNIFLIGIEPNPGPDYMQDEIEHKNHMEDEEPVVSLKVNFHCLNTNGSLNKQAQLKNYVYSLESSNPNDLNIFFLQEIKIANEKNQSTLRSTFKDHNVIINSTNAEHGVAMIYKTQHSQYVNHLILQDPQKALENRVIAIKITDTYFIGLYGPTHSNILTNKEKYSTQYKEILKIVQNQIISDKIILGGDLNVHIKTTDSVNNRIDDFFIKWMDENNFIDAIYLNPDLKRKPTYTKDPANSIIDRFLIKDTIDAIDIQYLPKDNYVTSDHLPIMLSINLKDTNQTDPSQTSFRTKRSFKKFEKNKERFNQEITDKWNRLKGNIHNDYEASPQQLELFTKILNDSANNFTKVIQFKQDAIDKDIKRITDKLNLLSTIQTNIQQKLTSKKTLKLQMLDANLPSELLEKPTEVINEIITNKRTKLIHAKYEQERNLKNLVINKWRKDINNATENQDTKKLYKFLKSKTPQTPLQSILIQENGNAYISQDPELVKEKARSSFQEKFNNPTIPDNIDPPYWFNYINKLPNSSNTDDLTKLITIEELQETTKYLANDKSPGPDNLENEIFKNLNQYNLKIVLSFLNHCITTKTIYQSWKRGYTSLIYKKGSQHDPNNYRPITLLSCFYKLYSRIITKRLTKIIKEENLLTNSQNGFLEGKSTKTCLFDALALFEDASINKTDLYTCYIDFANAFDSVPHEGIKTTLINMGFSSNIVDIILSLITSRTTQIITKYGLSNPVYINRGVPQGDVISPLLFIIFLNPLLAQIEKTDIGKAMANRTKFEGLVLAFADDIKLSASSLKDLQSMMDTVAHFSEKNGMTLNLGPNKTVFQYMRKKDWETAIPVKHTGELRYRKDKIASNHFNDNYHLYYKDTPIPQILPQEPYKYLGVPITMLLQWKYARRAIMEKITTRAHTLSYIPINGPTLANAINSMIISVVTYGGTFITFKNKHLNQLESLTRKIFLIQNKCKRAANKYTPFIDRNKGGCGEFEIKKEIHNIRILDFVRYINGNNKYSPMYLSLFSFPQNIKSKTVIFDENNFYFFLANPKKACVLKSKYNRSNYFIPKLIKSTIETKVAIKGNNLFHRESLEEILKFLREGKQPILTPNIITSGITDLRDTPYKELSLHTTENITEYNNLKKTLLSKPDEQKLQKRIGKKKKKMRETRNMNRRGEVASNETLIKQYLESEEKLKSLRDKLRKIRKEHKKRTLNYAHIFLNNNNTLNQQARNTIFLEATVDAKQKMKQSQIIIHRVNNNKETRRPTILNERDSNRTGKVPKSSIDSYLTKMEKNVLEKEEEKNKMVLQHKTNLSEYLIQNQRLDLLQTFNPALISEADIPLWKSLVQNSRDNNQIIIGIDGSNYNDKTAYALKIVKHSSTKITKSIEKDSPLFIKTTHILQESKQIDQYGSCYIAELTALLRALELISPFFFDAVIVGDNQATINIANFFLTKPDKPIKKQNKYKYLLQKLHKMIISYQGKLTFLHINSHLYDNEVNPSKIPTLNLINKEVDLMANRECHSHTPQFQTNFNQINSNPDKFYMEINGNLINSTKEIRKEQRSEQIKLTKEKIKSKRILRYVDCFNNKISNSFLLGARKELTRFRYKATNDLLYTSRDTKRVLFQSKYPDNIISENCPFCNEKEDTFEHRCFCNSSISQILRERRKAALLTLTNTLQKQFNIDILPFLEKYTDLTYLPNNLNYLSQLEQNNLIKFYLGKRNSKIHKEMKDFFQTTSDIPFNINHLNRSLLYILKTSWDESATIAFQIRSNTQTYIRKDGVYLSVQDIINQTTYDACIRKLKMNKIYQKDEDFFNKITYLPGQETEELQGPNHITTYLNDLHYRVQTFSNNSRGSSTHVAPETRENIT